ncbi:hypothetical protein SCA6_002512 [Theobroma cacao]
MKGKQRFFFSSSQKSNGQLLSLLGIAFLQSLSSQGNVAIETVQGAALDFILTHSLIAQKLMGDADKKSWASFQERIAKAPEQVLRYCRSASSKPLWPLSGGRPSKADIARCSYYGGPLCFEFQILPQLVYFFGVKDEDHSLDWATIAVYTCEASCEGIDYRCLYGLELDSQVASSSREPILPQS